MNRIVLPLLLVFSLAPLLSRAAEPNANRALAAAAEPQPDKASGNDAAQLKVAQEERIKVLTQLVEALTAQSRTGAADLAQVFSAENELCKARLESTDEPEMRIALLTKQLDNMSRLVAMTQGQVKAGIVSQADLLRAKSLYLEVKVKLLRERSGKTPPAPRGAKTAGGDATDANEEYKVIVMFYRPDGQDSPRRIIDPKTLETTLNELAKQGWKVRTTISDPRYVILARPRS
jgi:hypothetical protein